MAAVASDQIAELLKHPANKARLRKAAQEALRVIEGREAAERAEQHYLAQHGERAKHAEELAKCAADPVYWLENWVWTYNPKLVGKKNPDGTSVDPYLRFIPFPKQVEAIRWLQARLAGEEQGLWEKSRDVGASYICAAFALHQWLFNPGFKATFGSRGIDLVDNAEQPDAIFPKLRIMLRRLPEWMLPEGFNWTRHDNYMRLANPANGATIAGEGGKNMGRGGRSTIYFVDEAAFVENADKVEAALSGNTDVVIWVSSVNGMGNLFARKRFGGLRPEQIFRMHWRDDPRKTEEWAAEKKRSLRHIPTAWPSEYDIDYTASLEGVCIPTAWVESAKELRRRTRFIPIGYPGVGGLDVGAGKGKSVYVSRAGPMVRVPASRGDPDTTGTAHWAVEQGRAQGIRALNYDAPGVGVGVTSALQRADQPDFGVFGINTGEGAPSDRLWPDGRSSKDMFGNLKAEIWWLCRVACQNAHEKLQWLNGETDDQGERIGVDHPIEDCLLLPSGDPESDTLSSQLSLVKVDTNEAGKVVIEKKAALKKRGIPSPDYADALMLTFVDKTDRYDVGALV